MSTSFRRRRGQWPVLRSFFSPKGAHFRASLGSLMCSARRRELGSTREISRRFENEAESIEEKNPPCAGHLASKFDMVLSITCEDAVPVRETHRNCCSREKILPDHKYESRMWSPRRRVCASRRARLGLSKRQPYISSSRPRPMTPTPCRKPHDRCGYLAETDSTSVGGVQSWSKIFLPRRYHDENGCGRQFSVESRGCLTVPYGPGDKKPQISGGGAVSHFFAMPNTGCCMPVPENVLTFFHGGGGRQEQNIPGTASSLVNSEILLLYYCPWPRIL